MRPPPQVKPFAEKTQVFWSEYCGLRKRGLRRAGEGLCPSPAPLPAKGQSPLETQYRRPLGGGQSVILTILHDFRKH